MRASRVTLVASLAVFIAGCSVGPRPRTYGPARDPAGTTCTLVIGSSRQRVAGELLAVRASEAVMVVDHKVWIMPYLVIQASDCAHAGPIPFDHGLLLEGWAGEIRMRARYPQGINDELLARLLSAYGQSAPLKPAAQS